MQIAAKLVIIFSLVSLVVSDAKQKRDAAPVANSASVSGPNGQSIAITLDGSDPNGYPLSSLTAYIQAEPTVFPLLRTADSVTLHTGMQVDYPFEVTYTPLNYQYGAPIDSFTFTLYNPSTQMYSSPATINITIERGWHNPVWVAPNPSVVEDTPTIIQLTGYDPDGDAITCKWGAGTHGSWYEWDTTTNSIIQPALSAGDPFVYYPCYVKYFPQENYDQQVAISYKLFKSSYPSYQSGANYQTLLFNIQPVADAPVIVFNQSVNGTIQYSNIAVASTSLIYKVVLFDPDSPAIPNAYGPNYGNWGIHFLQMPTSGILYTYPDPFGTHFLRNLTSQNGTCISNSNLLFTQYDQNGNPITYWKILFSYGLTEENYGKNGTDVASFYFTDETGLPTSDVITFDFVISGTATVPKPSPVTYTATVNEGIGNVARILMNATDGPLVQALKFTNVATPAFNAAFRSPLMLLTFLPPTGVNFVVNTTNADFNTGSGTNPIVLCYTLENRVTTAIYRGGAPTCGISLYVTPVNDDPVITCTGGACTIYSTSSTSMVVSDVHISDVDCITGDNICPTNFTLVLNVNESSVATVSAPEAAGVSCTGSSPLVCDGSLADLNSMLATGFTVDVTAATPFTAHVTATVYDNGNVGAVFKNGSASTVLAVQFTG